MTKTHNRAPRMGKAGLARAIGFAAAVHSLAKQAINIVDQSPNLAIPASPSHAAASIESAQRDVLNRPRTLAEIINAYRRKRMLAKRRARLTDEERAVTSTMSKVEYERWLGRRRSSRFRARHRWSATAL